MVKCISNKPTPLISALLINWLIPYLFHESDVGSSNIHSYPQNRGLGSGWQEQQLCALLGCIKNQHCLSDWFVCITSPPVQCSNTGLKKEKPEVWNAYTTQQCAELLLVSSRPKTPAPNRRHTWPPINKQRFLHSITQSCTTSLSSRDTWPLLFSVLRDGIRF